MAATQNRRPPAFFWQAFFILLPVVVLAGFGLYSLRQDRLLAEQQARESGKTLAQQLVQAIQSEGRQQLLDYRNASFELHACRTSALGQSTWAGGAVQESNAWEHVKAWQRANPEIDLSSLPPMEPDPYVETQPETMPPMPPDWLGQLDSTQEQLWQAAKEAEFITGDFPAAQSALEKFIATKPPGGARANAEYLLLLAKSHGLSVLEASNVFAHSTWSQSAQVTEAGLPVGQLIWHQRLRLLPDGSGLSRETVNSIAWAITYHPSFLSSRLIAEVVRVTKGTRSETNAATLKAWWTANEKARMVLQDFYEQHPTNTWAFAPFWVNSRIGEYLLVLGDRRVTATNQMVPTINSYSYLMFPRIVMEKALATAAAKSDISLPPYALAEFEMGGKDLALSHPPNVATTNGVLPLLGRADGTLANLPFSARVYPFVVRVSLASPEILYARQSQRTRLFGGLIVASAFAAVMGLFAAWRSFRRQQELSELKTNFVSSVSHELRAPIASVRLMAENLERGKIPEPAKQGEYFRFIVQECRRLSSLIENVLDFSRIEQGRKQYEFEPTNLVALAETTVKLMEPYAAEKGVGLKFETSNIQHSTFNAELNVDGRAIQQALVNLIDNALKHSPKGEIVIVGIEGGTCSSRRLPCRLAAPQPCEGGSHAKAPSEIQEKPQPPKPDAHCAPEPAQIGQVQFVKTREQFLPLPGGEGRGEGKRQPADLPTVPGKPGVTHVLLSVTDHGPGIPPAEHEKIFERFYRLGSELRRETQGVGIGLSVVKHIVEAHGGRVRVESEVAKGSRFTIELPINGNHE